MNGRRKHGRRRLLATILMLAAVAVAGWLIWGGDDPKAPTDNENTTEVNVPEIALADSDGATPPGPVDAQDPATQQTGEPATRKLITAKLGATDAEAAYRRGMASIKADRLIDAHTQLNRAYYSARFSAERQNELRNTLSELADITLIGARTTVHAGDPYAYYYTFKPGALLAKVERTEKLHVPWQILLRINGLQRAPDIQAARAYKMIRGPFHAVVYKSAFTMDVFLHRQGLQRVFIKRMKVGTGSNGSTPAGMWRIRLGGKQQHPTWYPPANSRFRGPINYGDANYAFGAKGLWLSLEGLDDNTRPLHAYGIHSTNDPNSIGLAKSLGCIRLADDDIELLYALLYEHWSTVEVRP